MNEKPLTVVPQMTAEQRLAAIEGEYNKKIEYLQDYSKELRRQFDMLISLAKAYKPNDHSEHDRFFAIWITELEKAYAFYKTYLHVD